MKDQQQGPKSERPTQATTRASIGPGKRTRTAGLGGSSADAGARRPVQAKPAGSGDPSTTGSRVREDWTPVVMRPDLYQAPILTSRSTGHALPDPVQAKMASAFDSDFSAVRVHEGAHVSAMGARAYAQGDDIHFAPGQYQPEARAGQELLGHELAHVVQQRQGRVSGPQGDDLPINRDPGLEAEADRAGARAAAGESAGLSGSSASSARTVGAVIQGYFDVPKEDIGGGANLAEVGDEIVFSGQDRRENGSFLKDNGQTNVVHADAVPDLRVADDGKMAIESTDMAERQPKCFFVEDGVFDASNAALESVGSPYRLVKSGGTIQAKNADGTQTVTLSRVVAKDIRNETQGDGMTIQQNCDDVAGTLMGGDSKKKQILENQGLATPDILSEDNGIRTAAYLHKYADLYINKQNRAKSEASFEWPKPPEKNETSRQLRITSDNRAGLLALLREPEEYDNPFILNADSVDQPVDVVVKTDAEYRKLEVLRTSDDGRVTGIEITNTMVQKVDWTKEELKEARAPKEDEIAKSYSERITANTQNTQTALQNLGLNQKAAPKVGDAFATFSLGSIDGEGKIRDYSVDETDEDARRAPKWDVHWGGVIAVSGGDRVTLENYARAKEDAGNPEGRNANVAETRAFFRMTGSKVGQTWHDQMKADFVNPITTTWRNKERPED